MSNIVVHPNSFAPNSNEVAEFLDISFPSSVVEDNNDKSILMKLNQQKIMKIIDFTPPFLRTEKMVVFKGEIDSVLSSTSIGVGVITPDDTAGHYNKSIFLAMCGWLMASTASIHLAAFFPKSAPQVIEASGVKPLISPENSGIWKPAVNGTPYLVETCVLKKKMKIVILRTRISFGKILFGTIELLKFIITDRESIKSVKDIPLS